MQQQKKVPRASLRRQVLSWFSAVIAVVLLTFSVVVWVGNSMLSAFDVLVQDSDLCHRVQEAIEAESSAFEIYVRNANAENQKLYQTACTRTRSCLEALPFDYADIGEERYARTWNLLRSYEGYLPYRDAVVEMELSGTGRVDAMYRVMNMQDMLAINALRLVDATLTHSSTAYQAAARQFQMVPVLLAVVLLLAVLAISRVMRALSVGVVEPVLRMAEESRRIAENDFSGADLVLQAQDEVGQLVREFDRMKHAMADYLAAQSELHRQEVARLQLEKNLDQTRLEMLKSQVNPHFLFNTLHMISCMAKLEDAGTTDKMILALSSLFRYNLRTKEQIVFLAQELEALDDYIYIQQMRFDNRVRYEKQLLVDPETVCIPSFTLQPVVENAFVHGLASREEDGRILLRVQQTDGRLMLTVTDNGVGMTAEEMDALTQKLAASEQTGRSIGLGNLSKRIAMLYTGGSLQVYSSPGRGTAVQILIPVTPHEEEHADV